MLGVKFWIPWVIDAVIAAIAVFFFIVGLSDGSVSSFNIGLWGFILFALAVLVGGSLTLKRRGRQGVAIALLWILAVPGLLSVLFLLVVLLSSPRWN